ncbi:MAG: glucosaminidase domain-containing protein, partial [Clostridia bacterium]|nr:glucosaminidase domain-containing protein [Clostridia bacterium]
MKKYLKILSLLLCAVLLCSLLPTASAAEAEIKITSLSVTGFDLSFSPDTTYYLCYPPDFNGIKFTSIKTNVAATSEIKVERYCDYTNTTAYDKNTELNLGYGRAKVTVTVTSKTDANNKKSYLFALTDPNQDSYRYRYVATNNAKVYKTAAQGGTVIATLSKDPRFNYMPLCVGTSGNFTKIVVPCKNSAHGQIGWVKTTDLTEEYPIITPPQSYATQLAALKKAHPNWTFEYRYMNVSMEEHVNTVAGKIISNTSGTGTDKTQIATFMNPQNYFNEKNIFMFLDLSKYNAADYTAAGVKGVWVEKSNAVCTEAQAAEYLLDAGKSLRMNTYFITTRAIIESGYGTSNLSKGKAGSDGKLYYNFYGIGAYDYDPSNGTTYAQKRGWDSPRRSIIEGANWINDQYIQRGQIT